MKFNRTLFITIIVSLFIPITSSKAVFADDKTEVEQAGELYEKSLSELLDVETELKAEVGSRSGDRDLLASDVPIDVVTAEQMRQTGFTELSKILQRFIPGFNFPRPSITDGTDHVRPFTLRGMNPDQVLVLINGKRLHQSSLMNINGTIGRGTSGVDLNTIPIASIERVEVLRDGAAAQYGSDAIAGVINIILKGFGHKNEITATYGETKEGDGEVKQTDLFYSMPLNYDGFINISAEYRDRGETNRAGVDSRDQYPSGDPRNDYDAPLNHHYGDADTQDGLLSINSEVITENGVTFYLHALYDNRDSEAGAFFRRPVDNRNNTNIYPDGFLPMIVADIEDYSFSTGSKGILSNNIKWDLSYTYGYNEYEFGVENSHNDSLGDDSPTSFDSGETRYKQQIVNLDLAKKIKNWDIAGGLEFRNENYQIHQGEEASYILGDVSNNAGAQGFPGFQPNNEVDESRDNIAAYVDTKYHLSNDVDIGLAARYEDYSDFGSTFDGKLSLSYRPVSTLMLRTSASSGFRAPSLSQSYYTATTTGLSGDTLYQTGTFSVNEPVAIALGAVDLEPEESTHFTAGFVYQPASELSFSMDYFYTEIDDRIMLTGNIKETISPEVKAILNANGVGSARYFTNAISTKTEGIDLRLNYKYQFSNKSIIKTGMSYHYNHTDVTGVNTAPSILGANGQSLLVNEVTITTLEDGQPKENIKIYTQYLYKNYTVVVNVNKFGSYKSVFGTTSYDFDSKWTTDLDLSYQLNDKFNIAVGAQNIFNEYPDKWGETSSSIVGHDKILQYSQYSPFGYNGAFYYFRVGLAF
ncbi:MAG: TonB-dependent receptor [gamma proteobacterium symbiont of Taylorina sp.]|nr:TonB-dependent receptor [gamma proteobacterium symbiont of Taylorina sp.]